MTSLIHCWTQGCAGSCKVLPSPGSLIQGPDCIFTGKTHREGHITRRETFSTCREGHITRREAFSTRREGHITCREAFSTRREGHITCRECLSTCQMPLPPWDCSGLFRECTDFSVFSIPILDTDILSLSMRGISAQAPSKSPVGRLIWIN